MSCWKEIHFILIFFFLSFSLCSGTENDSGSVKKEKEKKNRKKDKENGSGSGEAGNRKDIDAPDAVVSTVFYSPDHGLKYPIRKIWRVTWCSAKKTVGFSLILKDGDDDDEDWAEETTEEAQRRRMEEISEHAKGLTLSDDLEKSLEERVNLFYNFVKVGFLTGVLILRCFSKFSAHLWFA